MSSAPPPRAATTTGAVRRGSGPRSGSRHARLGARGAGEAGGIAGKKLGGAVGARPI